MRIAEKIAVKPTRRYRSHREAIPTDSDLGSRAARALGSAGRTQRGLRQILRRVASVVLAGSGKGELHPEVDVGRLRLRPGGLLVLGFAAGTARAARFAVELPIRPAGLLPGSLAPGAPLPRVPAAPLAGFSLDLRLALSVAAIHRVRGACHVIVALLVARVAAERGLPDWWGHTRCPTVGTLPDSSRFMWSSEKPGPLPPAT